MCGRVEPKQLYCGSWLRYLGVRAVTGNPGQPDTCTQLPRLRSVRERLATGIPGNPDTWVHLLDVSLDATHDRESLVRDQQSVSCFHVNESFIQESSVEPLRVDVISSRQSTEVSEVVHFSLGNKYKGC